MRPLRKNRFRVFWRQALRRRRPLGEPRGDRAPEQLRRDSRSSSVSRSSRELLTSGYDEHTAGRSKSSPTEPGGTKRVQVGCGPHNLLDDWWNVDVRAFRGIDEVMDATEPWPYDDLEYVYGEHFLEHLPLDGALAFLEHAGNSLRPGGRMRLSTPNLEWVLSTHYPSIGNGTEERIAGTLRMNRAFHGWGHHFLYSPPMLRYILNALGFEEVSFFPYGESNDPNLMNMERHGGFSVDDGHPSVVIAEATRGQKPISPSADLTSRLETEFLRYVAAGH